MPSITWYPGHMQKAFNTLKTVIKNVDLVLEVRDARIPLSAANPQLTGLLQKKRHVIVLNKSDLVTAKQHKACVHLMQQQGGVEVLPASCTSGAGVGQVMSVALGWLQRERATSELSIMMVVGLPNSGKSSLINAFKLAAKKKGVLAGEQAYQKRASVGLTPGLTRQVAGFQVSAEPCVWMLDTPGIMVPTIPSDEVGFRLALAGAIKDSVVGEEAITKYLLQFLGRHARHSLRALRASGPIVSLADRAGSKQRTSTVKHSSKVNQQVSALRTCLYEVLSTVQRVQAVEDEPWGRGASAPDGAHTGLAHALRDAGGNHERHQLCGAMQQHLHVPPYDLAASEHDGAELAQHRYEVLMHCLGAATSRNPSKELGALTRLLRAFRDGSLGKYLLDAEVLPGD